MIYVEVVFCLLDTYHLGFVTKEEISGQGSKLSRHGVA